MQKRDKKVYLKDIIDAGTELLQLEKDAVDAQSFLSNNYYYRTAERLFQIIGESIYKLNNLDRKIPISDKEQIMGLRHLIVHDYDRVDYSRLWLFIKMYLRPLIEEIRLILEQELKNERPTQL
jgi:uncharacterized protein with HEPN domain